MRTSVAKPLWVVWVVVTIGLPSMLVYSAVRTYRALEEQKAVYLRSRIAGLAARLETLPAGLSAAQVLESVAEEPGLLDLAVLEARVGAGPDPLADLWEGRELFRTESLEMSGEPVFRAYVPFHSETGLRVARIDMAERSADFLVEHARHHLWYVGLGGLVIVALSLFTAWSVRRAMDAEHLAHIGKMSAVLAHEIRNPLGTIKGFAQLLEERVPKGEMELVAPILSETTRLEGLVNDLLLYGRPAQPSWQTIDSGSLAEGLRGYAQQAAAGSEVRFEEQIPVVTFETDPNLLKQALLNLIRNAIEAVREQPGGTVRLELRPDESWILWCVTDNGPGLSEEARRRLFEPFYTSKSFGTGLGLSITRKLAEVLGGEFMIGNRPEGGVLAEIRLRANRARNGR